MSESVDGDADGNSSFGIQRTDGSGPSSKNKHVRSFDVNRCEPLRNVRIKVPYIALDF